MSTKSISTGAQFSEPKQASGWLYDLYQYALEFFSTNPAEVIKEIGEQIRFSGDVKKNGTGTTAMTINTTSLPSPSEVLGNNISDAGSMTFSEQTWNLMRDAIRADVTSVSNDIKSVSQRFYNAYGYYPPYGTLTGTTSGTVTYLLGDGKYPPSGAVSETTYIHNLCSLLGTTNVFENHPYSFTWDSHTILIRETTSTEQTRYFKVFVDGHEQLINITIDNDGYSTLNICPYLIAGNRYDDESAISAFSIPYKVYNTYTGDVNYTSLPCVTTQDIYNEYSFLYNYGGYAYPTDVPTPTTSKVFSDAKVEDQYTSAYAGGYADTITPGRTVTDTGAVTGDVTITVPQDIAEVLQDYIDGTKTRTDVETAVNTSVVTTTDASTTKDVAESMNGGGGSTPVIDSPTMDIIDSGFISMWNPSRAQINSLASFMWDNTGIEAIKKFFDNPMDSIISLAFYPVIPPTSGTGQIKLGYTNTGVTGVKKISDTYADYTCGTMPIFPLSDASKTQNNFSGISNGAFYDYSPYTKAYAYLPFIGVVPLSATDIMRKYVTIDYHIEFITGSCLVTIKVTAPDSSFSKVLYTYTGNCMMQLPLTGSNFANIISNIGQIASGVASVVTGAMVTGASGGLATPAGIGMMAGGAGGVASGLSGIASDTIQRGGGMSGNSGFLGPFQPYILLERPKMHKSGTFNHDYGRYTQKSVQLKKGLGFTMVKNPHIEASNLSCTENERNLIYSKLQTGVIL